MAINKLPEYVINRLKAGEVVERPSSVLKEIVENSLDAGADNVDVIIKDGGKSFLSVRDNGSGIELSDMDLLLERYATSKIKNENDLYTIDSYGFRGEALASISEVSKTTVISKTKYSQIGSKLMKRGQEISLTHVPVGFEKGTEVIVEDLFYNVPARLKFLKSAQTEFYYCYNYFVDLALYHNDKSFSLQKNDTVLFKLEKDEGLITRINKIFKKDWSKNLIDIDYCDDELSLQGVVSDSQLRFGSQENIKIFVNGRIVQDKIIKKAIMDAHRRQITPGEFPLVVLFLQIDPNLVDVNVHPSKLQVKFADSQKIYQAVFSSITKQLSNNKTAFSDIVGNTDGLKSGGENKGSGYEWTPNSQNFNFDSKNNNIQKQHTQSQLDFENSDLFSNIPSTMDLDSSDKTYNNEQIGDYKIVGQIWNSYIVLESKEYLFYIDQHALAERIAFEKMKKELKISQENGKPEPLLNPTKFNVLNIPNLESKIEELNNLGFDCALLGDDKIVIYSVPKIFILYPIDLEKLLNHVLYLEEISFDHIFDGIFATKACKTSIKAGHKLGYQQMAQLVNDGFENIDGMFVCQHGRPFFVKQEKLNIDKMFGRI